ncbi:hypothetical protein LZ30DRAFT_684634 [Colletotrichum cereale]|nr:hypothetical protein LZ30DRAFT_684634 [Colletotrichum cereale]
MAPLWEFPPVPSACSAALQPRCCIMHQAIPPPATSEHSLVCGKRRATVACPGAGRGVGCRETRSVRQSVMLGLLSAFTTPHMGLRPSIVGHTAKYKNGMCRNTWYFIRDRSNVAGFHETQCRPPSDSAHPNLSGATDVRGSPEDCSHVSTDTEPPDAWENWVVSCGREHASRHAPGPHCILPWPAHAHVYLVAFLRVGLHDDIRQYAYRHLTTNPQV